MIRGLAFALAFASLTALADDGPKYMLSPADFEHGVATVDLSRPGTYVVRVWEPADRNWGLTIKDGKTVLESHTGRRTNGWVVVGKIERKEPGKVEITLRKPAEKQAETPKPKQTIPVTTEPIPAFVSVALEGNHEHDDSLSVARSQPSSVEDVRRTTVRTNQQGANFVAPTDLKSWDARAKAVREQLLVTLGLWPMPPKTDLHPRVFDKVERDGYTIEKVVIETMPGFTLSGNLYRPKDAKGRVPVILSPHGHWADGRVNPEVQPRCVHWAKLGCVVFMYDMVGYNDTKAFGHNFLNDRLNAWGFSLPMLQTWNSIRALDFLLGLPDVDPARVACTGESGGGTQTFLLTAIDQRVKFAAPIVMVSDSFQGGCVCENCAGLRWGTDNVEFAALAAPRPMKLVGATGDWTAKTLSNAYPALRRVYELTGSAEDLSADVFDFPHNYNETSRNAVYAFLAPRLLGIPEDKTKEGKIKIEEPKTLWTHGETDPRVDLKTPAQLESDLVALHSRQLEKLAPGPASAAWEASRSLLTRALEVRTGVKVPTPFDIDDKPMKRLTVNGVSVAHQIIGSKGVGDQIPIVRLTPAKPNGRASIIASPKGKAGLLGPNGGFTELVSALLAKGQSVIGFDPFLIGEAQDALNPLSARPNTVHYETYNPSLAVDRMRDLATVVAWTRSREDLHHVSLIASGEVGVLALLARPMLGNISRTAIDLGGFDHGDASKPIPAGLKMAGVLQFGGLKAAAALTSPSELWICRPGETFDASWPTKAYALDGSSQMFRLDKEAPTVKALADWINDGAAAK